MDDASQPILPPRNLQPPQDLLKAMAQQSNSREESRRASEQKNDVWAYSHAIQTLHGMAPYPNYYNGTDGRNKLAADMHDLMNNKPIGSTYASGGSAGSGQSTLQGGTASASAPGPQSIQPSPQAAGSAPATASAGTPSASGPDAPVAQTKGWQGPHSFQTNGYTGEHSWDPLSPANQARQQKYAEAVAGVKDQKVAAGINPSTNEFVGNDNQMVSQTPGGATSVTGINPASDSATPSSGMAAITPTPRINNQAAYTPPPSKLGS